MSTAPTPTPHRYPGLKPFERAQSAVFYGRSEDAQRLGNLILRERLVVLFAKSGIGKTSLLQAGVAPDLESKGFLPVFLRADDTRASIESTIANALKGHKSATGMDETDLRRDQPMGLWELMKRLEFDLDGIPVTPVLVFDQFEEVFTLGHSGESRQSFVHALADLVNGSMPEGVRTALLKRMQSADAAPMAGVMEWWEKEPELRVVVSIRSDFLHLLDEISPDVPGILRSRYQLQPLNRRQAEEAIVSPAAAQGEFASPPFVYSPVSMAEMVNFLAGKHGADNGAAVAALGHREEIESFNLQILCQFIEEKIIGEKKPAGFEVTPEFYGGKAGMEAEIRDFYKKQLLILPQAFTRRTGKTVDDPHALIGTAQRLIEESLVTPIGRRCSMVDDYLTSTWEVGPEFLDTLVDSRLLRKELRLDDYYYEISHDTLLPAIIASRDERRKKEKADQEKARLQQQLAEEAKRREGMEAELKSVREKRRLARQVSLLASVSFLLALGFGAWFLNSWVKSIKDELKLADRNFRKEYFEAALPSYDSLAASPLKSRILRRLAYVDVAQQGLDARRFNRLFLAVTERQSAGDTLFFQEDFAAALRQYRQAEDSLRQYRLINYTMEIVGKDTLWRIDPDKIAEKTRALDLRKESTIKSLIDRFKIRQRDAEAFMEAGVWAQALRNLQEMKTLLPAHPADIGRLQTALNLVRQTPADYVNGEINRCRKRIRGF